MCPHAHFDTHPYFLQDIVGHVGLDLLVDIARESINPSLHVFASKSVLNLRCAVRCLVLVLVRRSYYYYWYPFELEHAV